MIRSDVVPARTGEADAHVTAIGLPSPDTTGRRGSPKGRSAGSSRSLGAVVVFGAVIWAKGVSPITAYQEMVTALFASGSWSTS